MSRFETGTICGDDILEVSIGNGSLGGSRTGGASESFCNVDALAGEDSFVTWVSPFTPFGSSPGERVRANGGMGYSKLYGQTVPTLTQYTRPASTTGFWRAPGRTDLQQSTVNGLKPPDGLVSGGARTLPPADQANPLELFNGGDGYAIIWFYR